jgi:hypothetical protein
VELLALPLYVREVLVSNLALAIGYHDCFCAWFFPQAVQEIKPVLNKLMPVTVAARSKA